jgi:hypothetical protein
MATMNLLLITLLILAFIVSGGLVADRKAEEPNRVE